MLRERPSRVPLLLALTLVSAGAASATTWHDGDVISYPQEDWGHTPAPGNAAYLLQQNYAIVYGSTSGLLEIGIPGASGYSILFTSAAAVLGYLPAIGPAGPLVADLLDPGSSSSGVFGGYVTALRLNVDFADAGLLTGTSGLRFGDLLLYDLTATPSFDGLTIRQLLDPLQTALGGGPTPYSLADLSFLAYSLDFAFVEGAHTEFAQDHVAAPIWHDGDIETYSEADWGNPVVSLLEQDYAGVYAATSGVLEIGIPGAAGFSMLFTNATALRDYLSSSSDPSVGPLQADLVDPSASPSGIFGGNLTALRLNIDFSDAGLLPGTSELPFGDLILANFTTLPELDGLSVREFQDVVETALGGGPAPYALTDLNDVTAQLNSAFSGGLATPDAQIHLAPEPDELLMLGVGAIGLVVARRRTRYRSPSTSRRKARITGRRSSQGEASQREGSFGLRAPAKPAGI